MIHLEKKEYQQYNKQYLIAAIKGVLEELKFYAVEDNRSANKKFYVSQATQAQIDDANQRIKGTARIDRLSNIFKLSSFERKILLLCAGVELVDECGITISRLHGHKELIHPTFGLVLRCFSNAHWDAIAPANSLRKRDLVEVKKGAIIAKSKLIINESILHYLLGFSYLDEYLKPIIAPYRFNISLSPSQKTTVQNILRTILSKQQTVGLPILLLHSEDSAARLSIAAKTAANVNRTLFRISAHSIPTQLKEIQQLVKLWNREAALKKYALYIDGTDFPDQDFVRIQSVIHFINATSGLLFAQKRDWITQIHRPVLIYEINKPTRTEQLLYWKESLGEIGKFPAIRKYFSTVVNHFDLNTHTIAEIAAEVEELKILPEEINDEVLAKIMGMIWNACRRCTQPKTDELLQLIKPVATWDDLILPDAQKATLREIVAQVKQRRKVYDEWGFASKSSRGFGISALFSGVSGTGKTMAAEVLANELKLDLFQIDLSQVMDKYVGETEKNLKRVFDAAESSGGVLVCNEAESIIGSRGEGKDSQGHYINLKIGYLLQRMEDYKGLAILTTNLKDVMDKAFTRRIRFAIEFSSPGMIERKAIWERVFPQAADLGRLNYTNLAQLNLTGGSIKNIAMNAAFRAADEKEYIQMHHVAEAIHSEYAKSEKGMSRTELRIIRKGIWQSLLKTPTIDYDFLARFNFTIKEIRKIAKQVNNKKKVGEVIKMKDIAVEIIKYKDKLTQNMLEKLENFLPAKV